MAKKSKVKTLHGQYFCIICAYITQGKVCPNCKNEDLKPIVSATGTTIENGKSRLVLYDYSEYF